MKKDQHGSVWINDGSRIAVCSKKTYEKLSPAVPYDELPVFWSWV